MASSSNGRSISVPEESPFFCLEIVKLDDIRDGKKELPFAAVKKYGNQMGDHIYLKVPNSEEPWKVKLRKSPCGVVNDLNVSLHFVHSNITNFYLLEEGDSMLFAYEGEQSHFQVRITGWDGSETAYPVPGDETRAIVISSGDEQENDVIEIFSGPSSDGHEDGVIEISSGSSSLEHKNEAREK